MVAYWKIAARSQIILGACLMAAATGVSWQELAVQRPRDLDLRARGARLLDDIEPT